MDTTPSFSIFGIFYHQAGRTFQAQVQAVDAQQAVEVFWQEVVGQSPLVDGGDIAVEAVDDLGPAGDVPYPEVLPDHPALLAVVELKKREER